METPTLREIQQSIDDLHRETYAVSHQLVQARLAHSQVASLVEAARDALWRAREALDDELCKANKRLTTAH